MFARTQPREKPSNRIDAFTDLKSLRHRTIDAGAAAPPTWHRA
jgi:hypothetical protein